MRLVELTSAGDAGNEEIRQKANASSRSQHTMHYSVYENDHEVAFLSLDIRPDVDHLVLYEIFVSREFRRRGIATRLLAQTESLARCWGYRKNSLDSFGIGK